MNSPAAQHMLFRQTYTLDLLSELESGANDSRRFYYPGASRSGGKDGVMVKVTPIGGLPWIGVFASFDRSHTLLNAVSSCPDADMLCVVAGGSGYLVHASMPEWWKEVPLAPITQVLQLTDVQLLVLADLTSVCAWHKEGLAWRTPRIAWDNLRLTGYDSGTLMGSGADPTSPVDVQFMIDVMTGQHRGGSSPESYTHRVIRGGS